MAKPLEGGQNLQGGDGPLAAQILCAGHVPLSVGSGPARRAPAGLHRLGHLLALQAAQGLQRPAPDGLRRLRPARRAVCDPDRPAPGRDHRAEHRPLPRAAGQDRLLVRLGPRGAHVRPRLLQVDAVGVPQNVLLLLLQGRAAGAPDCGTRRRVRKERHRGAERRLHDRNALHGRRMEGQERTRKGADSPELPAGVPRRHDGQLVSEAGDRAGQRRSARRTFGPRRLSGRAEAHETMASARDRLRPADARRDWTSSNGATRSRRSSATGSDVPRAPRSSSTSRVRRRNSKSSPPVPTRSSA